MVGKKCPVSSSSLGQNALLMPEIRGEWPDWLATVTKIATHYNQGMQKII